MLGSKTGADYLVTGHWGDLACRECEKYGVPSRACDAKYNTDTTIPDIRVLPRGALTEGALGNWDPKSGEP